MHGTQIYRTDINGEITIKTDGYKVYVSTKLNKHRNV